MRRTTALVFALALLLALALPLAAIFAPRGSAAPSTGMRVTQVDADEYPQITLYVDARDNGGQPLLGLSRNDFALREDGQPVELDGFEGGGGQVSTVLVIDRSGSMADDNKLAGAQEAAAAFVDLMRPNDRTALLAFDSSVDNVGDFSSSQAALRSEIGILNADGGTALYDAIIAGVDALRGVEGRRTLIVLSDGADCREPGDDCPAEYGSDATMEEAIAYANAAAQPVYLMGLGDKASSSDNGIDEGVLRQIAEATNGDYFYAPQGEQLAALYTQLAGNIQQEYRLSYTSPRPFYDGTRRDIEVIVGGENVSGTYTESHLINVVSNPVIGGGLLAALLGMLALPVLVQRRNSSRSAPSSVVVPATAAAPPRIDTAAPASAAAASTPARPMAVVVGEAPRCEQCDRPLRPGARFCNGCGAPAQA